MSSIMATSRSNLSTASSAQIPSLTVTITPGLRRPIREKYHEIWYRNNYALLADDRWAGHKIITVINSQLLWYCLSSSNVLYRPEAKRAALLFLLPFFVEREMEVLVRLLDIPSFISGQYELLMWCAPDISGWVGINSEADAEWRIRKQSRLRYSLYSPSK